MICLSKRIPTRFQFGIELEGDLKSEIEYLRAHYYKKHFYDKTIAQMSAALKRQNYYLAAAKGIIVVSDELKVQMQNAEVSSKNVYWTTGTGFSREHIRFCEFSRKIIRDQLNITGVCLIYIGNVFYSWQNISDTLLYFKRFNLDCPESKFIVLTPRSQFGIVEYFAKIHQISLNKICLRSVRNEEVYKYLSAADVGVLLRKDSTVNKVSCPGKVGEYLAAGLPCVLTKYIGDYEKSLRDKDFVSMLSLTESQEYVISEITRLSRISLSFRRQISIFAKQEFSALKNIKNFVAAFDWQPSSSVREGLNKSS
jgi:glycosyltransferase involved in cell wall biosynthesis